LKAYLEGGPWHGTFRDVPDDTNQISIDMIEGELVERDRILNVNAIVYRITDKMRDGARVFTVARIHEQYHDFT